MKKQVVLFITLFFLSFCTRVGNIAAQVTVIQWKDLAPAGGSPQEKLYQSFSEEEKGLAEWLLYMKQTEPEDISTEDPELINELEQTTKILTKKGFDIEVFAAARKISNMRVNTQLDGRKIRLAGYLLPLEAPGGRIREFLFVPYVGACIHVPPPPPNQIIFATIDKQIKELPETLVELFAPVSVTGVLGTRGVRKNLFLVDGSDDIVMGYTLKVEKIEPYSDFSVEEG